MPKKILTVEQKALNKALKKQAEEDARIKYEFEKQAALESYKVELPKRLMTAQATAAKLGVATHVELIESGVSVRFEYEDHIEKIYIDETVTYNTEEYEIEMLEYKLRQLKDSVEEHDRRRLVADSVFKSLTDEQKSCVKEFISYMR